MQILYRRHTLAPLGIGLVAIALADRIAFFSATGAALLLVGVLVLCLAAIAPDPPDDEHIAYGPPYPLFEGAVVLAGHANGNCHAEYATERTAMAVRASSRSCSASAKAFVRYSDSSSERTALPARARHRRW